MTMIEHVDWDSMLAKVKLENDTVGEITPILEPCPFCGITPNKVTIVDQPSFYKESYAVECPSSWSTCAVKPRTRLFETEAEAIEAWNHRASDQ